MDLNTWLSETELVVCVGSGGVGKTTTSAAIALWGAVHGRRAMVLTIDPAKRLANSLGFDEMGGEATRVDLSSIPSAKGELWAMMLDSRSTMDGLISSIAPDEASRDRILNNHVYQHMADTFAGSQDYMATEKLYDLVSSGKYDLVVLDTPPVKNALDFLESPGRVVNFLDEKVLHWFLDPHDGSPRGLLGRRLMLGTSAVVYRLLGHVFGPDFLEDLAVFFHDFRGLYEGFRTRHGLVLGMLRKSATSFVTVCAPTESSLDVAVFFQQELRARDLPRGGVVVNQVHTCHGDDHDAHRLLRGYAERRSEGLPTEVVASVLARLGRAHRRLRSLHVAEQRLVRRVRASASGSFYAEVPRLRGEVHDLPSLLSVGAHLFEARAEWLGPRESALGSDPDDHPSAAGISSHTG